MKRNCTFIVFFLSRVLQLNSDLPFIALLFNKYKQQLNISTTHRKTTLPHTVGQKCDSAAQIAAQRHEATGWNEVGSRWGCKSGMNAAFYLFNFWTSSVCYLRTIGVGHQNETRHIIWMTFKERHCQPLWRTPTSSHMIPKDQVIY